MKILPRRPYGFRERWKLQRQPGDLPREHGFKFDGVMWDGQRIKCEIRIDGRGRLHVTDLNGKIYNDQLRHWVAS